MITGNRLINQIAGARYEKLPNFKNWICPTDDIKSKSSFSIKTIKTAKVHLLVETIQNIIGSSIQNMKGTNK